MMTDEPTAIHVCVADSMLVWKSFPATVWITETFAPDWFADAIHESHLEGPGARRREIIFGVCCAESYLLEWVRDEVLNREFGKLKSYFPPDDRKGVDHRGGGRGR